MEIVSNLVYWLFKFIFSIIMIGLFYFMIMFFYIGFTLESGNCYDIRTGNVTVCESGEHVEYRPAAFWHR